MQKVKGEHNEGIRIVRRVKERREKNQGEQRDIRRDIVELIQSLCMFVHRPHPFLWAFQVKKPKMEIWSLGFWIQVLLG